MFFHGYSAFQRQSTSTLITSRRLDKRGQLLKIRFLILRLLRAISIPQNDFVAKIVQQRIWVWVLTSPGSCPNQSDMGGKAEHPHRHALLQTRLISMNFPQRSLNIASRDQRPKLLRWKAKQERIRLLRNLFQGDPRPSGIWWSRSRLLLAPPARIMLWLYRKLLIKN